MSSLWLKIFFNCELDTYGLPLKINDPFFKNNIVPKQNFLDRIIEVNPNFNYNQMYFEFRKLKASGIIKEMPKKQINIIELKLSELKKGLENDIKT